MAKKTIHRQRNRDGVVSLRAAAAATPAAAAKAAASVMVIPFGLWRVKCKVQAKKCSVWGWAKEQMKIANHHNTKVHVNRNKC